MTALGKTLVFFNLLFSLVTGGLIVMVFVTRTNWKNGMEAAMAETKAVRAEAASYKSQLDQIAATAANQKQSFESQLKEKDRQIDTKDAEIANQKQQNEAAHKDTAEQTEVTKAQSKEITRLQNERNQKDEYLKIANDTIVKITYDLANMTQEEKFHHLRGDQLDKDLSSLKESFALLQKKYEEVLALVPRDLLNKGAQPNAPRRPSVETTGSIVEADGNFAVISLGSDNGILQGHELDVYRTSPNPVYLGKLIVTRSEPHRAVGNFLPSGKGKTIKAGDTVDTALQH